MSNFLLTQIINYGAPILGVVVFLSALGIPLPGTLTVIAAGAFVRQGILTWPITASLALACTVIGDSLSYGIGYFASDYIRHHFRENPGWLQAKEAFQRWGPMSIFFSRFLVTAIAIPINLLAGTGNFPYKRFLIYDTAGEVIWILGFGGLGYFFGSQWELISDFVSNFGGLMLGIVLLTIGLRWSIQRLRSRNLAKEKVLEG